MAGIQAAQFQELLVQEFRRQCGERCGVRWPMYRMMTGGLAKVARIRWLSQYVIDRELRFNAEKALLPRAGRSAHGFALGDHDDEPDTLEMRTIPMLKVYLYIEA